MRFYSEVGSQYRSRKIFIQALITSNSSCFLNGETISWSSHMISTYETYISSGCKVSHNALPNFIFPHIFCAHLDYVKQQVQFERASFRLKQSYDNVPTCKISVNSSCKCIVFLPLVFGVIMSEYLCHDRVKTQLFFSGRISEQMLLWDISA